MHVMQVPNSSGTARPKLTRRPNACDCHMHIYDGGTVSAAAAAMRGCSRMPASPDYRLLQQRIGTQPRRRGDAGRLSSPTTR